MKITRSQWYGEPLEEDQGGGNLPDYVKQVEAAMSSFDGEAVLVVSLPIGGKPKDTPVTFGGLTSDKKGLNLEIAPPNTTIRHAVLMPIGVPAYELLQLFA